MAREMKDSGVEWIGEIPEDWEIRRIKYIAEFEPKCNMSELNNNSIVTYLPMECLKNGYFERREHNLGDLSTSLTRFQENDIVMAKVTPCFENGNIAIMQKLKSGFGVGSSELFVLRCKKVNVHYLFWWLQNKGFVSQACSTMVGTGGLKRISPYFIKNCAMHMPPETEQVRISNFLHVQCVELDNVLEKTRASIEEYKKLKQAVITQAVTKGIRGNREMRDSGIEWIGDIPRDWEVYTVFQLFVQVKNKNIDLREKNLLSLSYGKIKQKPIDTVKGLLPENFEGYNIVEKEDIVLRLTDLQNDQKSLRVGFVTERGIVTSAYCTIRAKSVDNSKYLYYYLHSFDIAKGFYGMGAGVRQGLNWDGLKKLKIIIPSLEEQQEIVMYLDQKCSAIDDLIVKKEQYLSEIENYKKSLIYEYVTGKKEVPQGYWM